MFVCKSFIIICWLILIHVQLGLSSFMSLSTLRLVCLTVIFLMKEKRKSETKKERKKKGRRKEERKKERNKERK